MDSIFSVRINEDLKNKFLELAEEEGVNNKEFMDLIIKSYEMNKAVVSSNYIKGDIEELQSIIKRILDIYMNIADKSSLRITECKNNYVAALQKEEERTFASNKAQEALKEELEALKNDKNNLENIINDNAKELMKEKETTKEYKEMLEILKAKALELEGYKANYETLLKENAELSSTVASLKERISKYEKDTQRYCSEIDKLQEQLLNEENSSKSKLQDIRDELLRKSTLKEEELLLRHKQEAFEKNEAYRNELWSLKNSYEEKISKLNNDKSLLLDKLENALIKN